MATSEKCACLSLHKSARVIGTVLFIMTVGLFVAYLIFIENLRRIVLEEMFEIAPCSQPWIDIVTDSLFEYSLLVNLLLIGTCVGCTRWILVPWLVLYAINIVLLVVVSIYMFINPIPVFTTESAHYELLRLFGLVPLAAALLLSYFWIVVRNLFGSISTLEKKNEEQNGCCNLNYKLGVQIMAGLLTIFSAVFLVLHHLKVKEMIDAKFERMFKQEPRPEWNLTHVVSTIIMAAIAVNLLVFFGSTGERWRRVFLMPWLIYYGIGILIAFGSHQWLTTLCWVEEKLYGLIALGIGFFSTILWTCVWIVAAEAADKPQVMLNRNPLGFQRL